jgi:putative NADH-flavin reductase
MKILIAGSNGYLGKQVFKRFKDYGYDVFSFYRIDSKMAKNRYDICHDQKEMYQSFDVIINCARPHWSTHTPIEISEIEQNLMFILNQFAKPNAIKIHTSGV